MTEHKNNPTLWIFGHSVCLPYNLNDPNNGWDRLLAKKLNYNLINLAQPGSDNFYIYQCYLQHKEHIKKEDTVLIAWSHYSRKSFVLDRNNTAQTNVLDKSLLYKTKDIEFIRKENASAVPKWTLMSPVNSGALYYDSWFENYYSAYEQKCNFQSYFDSVATRCNATYLPFFLSQESIKEIDVTSVPNAGSIVEFILEHNVMISKEDMHFNVQGHSLWAEHVFKQLSDI